jgi:hypothetical protein
MKKFLNWLLWLVIGVVGFEVVVAVYKVPIASLPMMIAFSVGGLVFLMFGRIFMAMLKDRSEERRAWLEVTRQQSVNYQQGLNTVAKLNYSQQALVESLIQMGAYLAQAGSGQHYAQFPSGNIAPIEAVEAEYWQEIAPDKVAGQLPSGKGRGK